MGWVANGGAISTAMIPGNAQCLSTREFGMTCKLTPIWEL